MIVFIQVHCMYTHTQTFLTNYTEVHGLLLPGRVPGYSKTDIKLLPSSQSKRGIWRQYQSAMAESGERAAAYTTFCQLWQILLPAVVVMKPMSDLCWTCQQHSAGIQRATATDIQKSTALQVRKFKGLLEVKHYHSNLFVELFGPPTSGNS